MPIFLAPFVAFALGVAVAWAARFEIATSDAPVAASRPFLITALFAAIVFAPITGYFVAYHPDWAYAYFVRREAIPSAIDLTLVVLSSSFVLVGFIASARSIRHSPAVLSAFSPRVATFAALPVAIACIAAAFASRRLGWSGTYAQFRGNFGLEPIAASPLGRGLVIAWIALALGVAWAVAEVRRDGSARYPPRG